MADIRNLDLNLLVALDALLDERSVTRAALRLGLTQPSVSGMLARLRRHLGDPLFVRTSHGLRPTPHADSLAAPVKRLLADAAAILTPAEFDPVTAERTFALTTTDYGLRAVVSPFIAAMQREAPGLRFAVHALAIADLPERLAGGEIDLAVTLPEFAAPDLMSRLLYRERYVAVVGPHHPACERPMTVEAFCGYGHVLVSPSGGGFRGPVDEGLAALGHRRRVAVSVPSFLAVPDLLRGSDLIAVLPQRMLQDCSVGLRSFPVPVEVPGFDMIAAWHTRSHQDPGHRWLRERLVATVQGD